MKIEIGSRVKFLNDIGGGIVRGFEDEKLVLVETDDGFEIPVLANELIIEEQNTYSPDSSKVDSPSAKESHEGESIAEPRISYEEKKYHDLSGKVLLAIVPENDKLLHVSNFTLYIVNDSNYYFHYVLSQRDGKISTLIQSGTIEPEIKLSIEKYSQTSITKVKEFHIQGFFFKHGLMTAYDPVEIRFHIENISFYKAASFHENEYFHQRAFLSERTDTDMIKAIEQLSESELGNIVTVKESKTVPQKSKSSKSTTIEEVDLHIEEIVDDYKEMSNGEIVDIQLSRFETALEAAIRENTPKIVFIHGVGNGKLKYDLRKKLDTKYPDLRYQDASFKEYGYGATMVYLR